MTLTSTEQPAATTPTPRRRRRKPLSPRAYRILVVIHALFGAAWLGTAVAGLLVLTVVMNAETVVGASGAVRLIDLLLYIPLDIATLVTGLIFSIRTHWAFLKHGWVAAKYLINFTVLITAGVVLSPAVIEMDELTTEHGSAAWRMAEFQSARALYTWMIVFYVVILGIAVALPLIKPRIPLPLQGKIHPLRVVEVRPETADSATIVFAVPRLLRTKYRYRAGQYVTLYPTLDGAEQRRAYSLSSEPAEPQLAVTLKRVPGGLVSNWLLDNLHAGDRLRVAQPQGRFGNAVQADGRGTYVLVGAGSGITPLASIAKALLRRAAGAEVHLLYGNRTPADVILGTELTGLADRPGFHWVPVFSRLRPNDPWRGARGHIDHQLLGRYVLDNRIPDTAEYFVCGPEQMIEDTVAVLADLGVSDARIHRESFVTATPVEKPPAVDLVAVLDGEELAVSMDPSSTVTETLEKSGFDPPYTCKVGTCSSCVAQIVEGAAQMAQNHSLNASEVADGLILTCQAHPTTPRLVLDFDAAQ